MEPGLDDLYEWQSRQQAACTGMNTIALGLTAKKATINGHLTCSGLSSLIHEKVLLESSSLRE